MLEAHSRYQITLLTERMAMARASGVSVDHDSSISRAEILHCIPSTLLLSKIGV